MRSYRAAVAQNISKKLQHAYQKTNDRLIELARQQHRLEQYCYFFDEIGVKLNENEITCHRLGKTDRTIAKLLNRKDAVKLLLWDRKTKKMLMLIHQIFFQKVILLVQTV